MSADSGTAAAEGVVLEEYVAGLARRAGYWWERSTHRPAAGSSGEGLVQEWTTVLGSRTALSRRLQWEGLSEQGVGGLLAARSSSPQDQLPSWAASLHSILATFDADFPAEPMLDPEARFAFEELLVPIVGAADTLLTQQAQSHRPPGGGDILAVLEPAARRDLQRALLARLAAILSEPLYAAFGRVRPYGPMLLGALDAVGAEGPDTAAYDAFVAAESADSLRGFFDTYPVAARLVATAVEQWVEAVYELLHRFSEDLPLLCDGLIGEIHIPGGGVPLIARVEASLSDAHRGGRSVAVLTLIDGQRVVYKPKSLATEAALGLLLRWCSAIGEVDLRWVKVLDRGTYGWAEYIDQLSCRDIGAVGRYYQRAGALLCVLHLLRASDCHHGNLVAHGEYPVLIDAETLCHPRTRSLHGDAAGPSAGSVTQEFLGSVLRTMMLPSWHVGADGTVAYDISGLGSSASGPVPYPVRDWAWINTDAMALRDRVGELAEERNIVRVGDDAQDAVDFVPEIVAGYTAMYEAITARRSELVATDGPLSAFRELPTRFLFRGTRVYASILTSACAAEHLTDGVRFSLQLDRASVAFVQGAAKPAAWPILRAELRALGQLDIPYFQGLVSSDSLSAGEEGVIPRFFEASSFDDVLVTLDGFGDHDLAWQTKLIEGSFLSQVVRVDDDSTDRAPASTTRATHAQPPRPRPVSHLDVAIEVGSELAERSLLDSRGEAHWLGLGLVAQTERVQLELIGDTFYDGRCGVALFLSALHQATSEPRWAELAHASLFSLERLGAHLHRYAGDPALLPSLGALGSMVYAVTRTSQFLAEPQLLELADPLAAAIDDALIHGDTGYDVLSGSAGAIFGLLSLHQVTGHSQLLAKARTCGDHLLAHRDGSPGTRAWTTLGTVPLTGFSHGAAGIARALLRLHEATGESRFHAAAVEAMEYERTLFSPEHRNWPDLRLADGQERLYPDQWCHGASGIVLARLGALSMIPGDVLMEEEIRAGLSTTSGRALSPIDHLCCGNAGRIEALLVGAAELDHEPWHTAAARLTQEVLERRTATGGYRLFPTIPRPVFNPGFFRGVAGIGYQWLRMADPELPSALSWQ